MSGENKAARKVYLAGPINGQSDDQCKGWRADATKQLLSRGLAIADPMTRDYRGVEDQNVAAIVEGDLQDIGGCDVVLVNAQIASWGTAMELVYARQYGKRIVAFVGQGRVSPWLRYHIEAVFPTIEQAVSYIAWEAVKP